MQPPPSSHDLRQKAAIGAVETMEETMRVLTLTELMRLTRMELCELIRKITTDLPSYVEGSPARHNALITLQNIRYVLGRRDLSP
jgi:hypothetical protein